MSVEDEGGETVLYLDDDAERAALVPEFVERETEGVECVSSTAVGDVNEAVERADPDCVVSAHDFDGHDGEDLYREIRACRPGMPFVVYAWQRPDGIPFDGETTRFVRREIDPEHYAELADAVGSALGQKSESR